MENKGYWVYIEKCEKDLKVLKALLKDTLNGGDYYLCHEIIDDIKEIQEILDDLYLKEKNQY
ncbi:MAG: hypothetical protein ACRCZ0_08660 [Cetobacterium sp.]